MMAIAGDAPIRALIVEDEPQARRILGELLAQAPDVELVGTAAAGHEAIGLIDRVAPDLVFLDVELPELSGLEVVDRIRCAPELVFTTAFDQYALAAFELGALDYLLKPFGRERFDEALRRVRQRIAFGGPTGTERARATREAPLRRLFARRGERIVPIPVASIRRIRADGDYAEVHCDSGQYLLRMGLNRLVERLDAEQFLQVHRSHIVNLDEVAWLQPYDERRLLVRLRDGTEIVASRTASERLRSLVR